MSSMGKTRPGWLFHAAALAALACLLALGTWQVQRLAWKEGLIASIDARMRSAPVSLTEVERTYAETSDVDYLPVALAGTILPGHEQYFLSTHEGQSGWNVYAPLQLPDQRILMLNRGFVPYELRDAAKRGESLPTGVRQVKGLARNPLTKKPSSITPENDPVKNVWYWKDLTSMAANAGIAQDQVLPFFVDDWTERKSGMLPVTRTTIVSLPNNHLQYAITWYGLAAALAAIWAIMTFRRPSSISVA
jgi:surfeit locus 1 family protein